MNNVTTSPPALSRHDFHILPRRGLVLVAVVAAVLVYAIHSESIWLLVILHVGGGATWMVLDVFLGFVLGPILGSMPVESRVQIAVRLLPRTVLIMPTAVTLTLAGGLALGIHTYAVPADSSVHNWIVASYVIGAFLEVTALGFLQPANIAVLAELKREYETR